MIVEQVRVPSAPRFEFRLGDGAANPYLLQAVVIASGLDGLERGTDPGLPCFENMYSGDPAAIAASKTMEKLPLYLLDALRNLEGDTALRARLDDGTSCAHSNACVCTPT